MLSNPRPRKYANAAERQKAYRARYATEEVRLLPETAATVTSIAAEIDLPKTELLAQMINFALLNRDWRKLGGFGRRTPSVAERKSDAFGYWVDFAYDRQTRLYTAVVRDANSNIVSLPRTFDKRADFAKLKPADFEPLE